MQECLQSPSLKISSRVRTQPTGKGILLGLLYFRKHISFEITPFMYPQGFLIQDIRLKIFDRSVAFQPSRACQSLSTEPHVSQEASTLSQRLPEGLAFGKETAGSKIPLLGRLIFSIGLLFSEADSGCLTGSDRLHCAQRKLILEQYEYGKAGIGSLYWDTTDGVTTYMNKPLS
ncbi:hypothetical protein NEUTE1DRAFT_102914 [Neurospora tetrasperma FGSC 2508]|uniref:Uncharacterized protein n=1 Tax=Neurospora tetrasperma (strain FGSC 2508 / ATCC MYA-4615 / P0657) TaxID=510951 RepID=F8MU01_NEUT8|nr:uncharacterized protein NEUTE1DRAFT_102914 [Neurospora tetrasperma FGSC 2508]EGO55483.1 hypothetical protein NEUTE1DRAFT_102914 [Neurospora tetrasperma FGSC 2508]EGZ69288.1 hypothetical protein NEUTE2DRAFT_131680 [Neurospora tetrasperma FGSC 2509]